MLRTMTSRLALLLLALAALPAAGASAETVVPPAEFLDYARGYTLTFEENGEFAGAESFADDGRVTMETPEGVCYEGLVRSYDDRICFFYGVSDQVHCWHALRDAKGLKVRSLSDGAGQAGQTYRITGRSRRPVSCQGPAMDTGAERGRPLSRPAPRPARW